MTLQITHSGLQADHAGQFLSRCSIVVRGAANDARPVCLGARHAASAGPPEALTSLRAARLAVLALLARLPRRAETRHEREARVGIESKDPFPMTGHPCCLRAVFEGDCDQER